ncbi:Rieske (2Fe-2S) protein [Rathayibacter sp. YIM 133350]|uniref:Rieske (2Fe-2S) protein n=1 Tax=Rathayibacter sp. YIM 133350 TaxID=3131992 RepID=UPI00307EA9D1
MSGTTDLTRRGILSIGGAGAAAIALAACAPSSPTGSGDSSGDSGGADATPGGTPSGTGSVAKLSDIPVGGSIDARLGDAPILLAQPTAGTVVGYSAICTHQGCVVAAAGAHLDCPCHKSSFDAATGDVLSGPAPKPLQKLTVTVTGDDVSASA